MSLFPTRRRNEQSWQMLPGPSRRRRRRFRLLNLLAPLKLVLGLLFNVCLVVLGLSTTYLLSKACLYLVDLIDRKVFDGPWFP